MLTNAHIEMSDGRLIKVSGGEAAVLNAVHQYATQRPLTNVPHNAEEPMPIPAVATTPRATPLATNVEEPLEVPAMNFDAVRHVGGGRMPDSELRKLETPANYGALAPVPSDCEEALEVPRVL